MKKYYFSIVLIIIAFGLRAQYYLINFNATGISNVVDSVRVENISTGQSISLLGSDTLLLRGPNGIEENFNHSDLSAFPNPFQDFSEINFESSINSNSNFKIYDIKGEIILNETYYTQNGLNKFLVKGLRQGVYILKINNKDEYATIKLICNSSSNDIPKISIISSNSIGNSKSNIKTLTQLSFLNGQGIKYIGYSGCNTNSIIEVPNISKTITFHFTEFVCNEDLLITHNQSNISPINKTVTYKTKLSTIFGAQKCIIQQNLGATHSATSKTDTTEANAGWYWQFNKKQGFRHDAANRFPNTTWITSIDENSNWLQANDPCSNLLNICWRLPTLSELNNALSNNNWTNADNVYNSDLILHMAGFLHFSDGVLTSRGSGGRIWSNSESTTTNANYLVYNNSLCNVIQTLKTNGLPVRCVKD